MLKSLTLVGLIFIQEIVQASECNGRLLEMNSDTFFNRIVSETSISEGKIKESLDFLPNNDKEESKLIQYIQKERIESIYKNAEKLGSNKSLLKESQHTFQQFLDNCLKILNEPEKKMITLLSKQSLCF